MAPLKTVMREQHNAAAEPFSRSVWKTGCPWEGAKVSGTYDWSGPTQNKFPCIYSCSMCVSSIDTQNTEQTMTSTAGIICGLPFSPHRAFSTFYFVSHNVSDGASVYSGWYRLFCNLVLPVLRQMGCPSISVQFHASLWISFVPLSRTDLMV